jgi:membrane protein YqaA with SNARE-associated domain
MEYFFQTLLTTMALPQYGLTTLFIVSFLAATLLPLGSEPVLLGLITLNPDLAWWALGVATLGNTLGGVVGWWMGWGAERWMAQRIHLDQMTAHMRAMAWLERIGPAACLGAWLPVIGDPLCMVAGYLRLSFWPCVAYMAVGKGLRYAVLIFGWQSLFSGFSYSGSM